MGLNTAVIGNRYIITVTAASTALADSQPITKAARYVSCEALGDTAGNTATTPDALSEDSVGTVTLSLNIGTCDHAVIDGTVIDRNVPPVASRTAGPTDTNLAGQTDGGRTAASLTFGKRLSRTAAATDTLGEDSVGIKTIGIDGAGIGNADGASITLTAAIAPYCSGDIGSLADAVGKESNCSSYIPQGSAKTEAEDACTSVAATTADALGDDAGGETAPGRNRSAVYNGYRPAIISAAAVTTYCKGERPVARII